MKKSKSVYTSMSRGEKLLGWILLLLQLLLPYLLGLLNRLLSDPINAGTLAFVRYGVSFVLVAVVFRKFLKSSLAAGWKNFWNVLQAAVLGYAAWFACSRLLDWLIGLILPGYAPLADTSVSALADANGYLRIIGTVILVPVIEETLYRGLVYRSIWRKSKFAAYLVSMLVFSAVHMLLRIGSGDLTALLVCFVRYLPAGLCFAWSYSKADNVLAPMLVHAGVNAAAIGLFSWL